MSLIRISESDDWFVDYDKERGMYRVSYFQDNHFLDECWFDCYEEKELNKSVVISSDNKIVIAGNKATINGIKTPPCPGKGCNLTTINNKIYLNGYELVNGKWKKTLKALWHKWFN